MPQTKELICPLLTLGNATLQTAVNVMAPHPPNVVGVKTELRTIPCVQDKCAWWDGSSCAVKKLGEWLPRISANIIGAGEEIVDNMPKKMGFREVEG